LLTNPVKSRVFKNVDNVDKKVSTKTPFGEKRMKVWKYKDLQLFDIKMWITLCKQKNPHSKVEVFPN